MLLETELCSWNTFNGTVGIQTRARKLDMGREWHMLGLLFFDWCHGSLSRCQCARVHADSIRCVCGGGVSCICGLKVPISCTPWWHFLWYMEGVGQLPICNWPRPLVRVATSGPGNVRASRIVLRAASLTSYHSMVGYSLSLDRWYNGHHGSSRTCHPHPWNQ